MHSRTKPMELSRPSSSLLPFILLFLFVLPISATQKSYIVYMGEHSHAADPTSIDLDRVRDSHYDLLGSYVGSEKAKDKIFYSYTRNINGFAAILEEDEAAEIAKHPDVVSVFLNQARMLHTTRSWDFLRLEKDSVVHSASLWKKAKYGEDVIIGNLDTGVWPESESFGEEGMGEVPSSWRGICQNNTKKGVLCNRKLIGARYFNKGYAAFVGNLNSTISTPRDEDGHGSHTLSTAGGNFVPGANVFGFGNGTAKGGSPRARVAAYKVCWNSIDGIYCFDADIMAAFDAAIGDGVDVLSLSLGGDPNEFFADGISIGAFHAVRKGIVVVCSAGNSGPEHGTVSNLAPWIFTVGASTIDREFTSYVRLGNNKQLKGTSLSTKSLPSEKFYPLISAADAKAANSSAYFASLCLEETLDSRKVKGKILVCLRGVNGRAEKGQQAALAGAVGMILANDEENGNELIPDPHILPASHVNFTDGQSISAYIKSNKNPTAYISPVKTETGSKPAPVMAAFSSRGPSLIEPAILKPDITAPGVSIIAAYTGAQAPTELMADARRTPFTIMSGTSMSCPHVSGVAGLLRAVHPDWSPAAIKSAIMTTARIRDNNGAPMLATPFDYGAGHVRPNRAMDPGLVYDTTTDDYLNFLCAHGYNETQIRMFSIKPYTCQKSFSLTDLNYPSISVPSLNGRVTITRRVKNVGSPSTYRARVAAPSGVSVSVKPERIKFERDGEEKEFEVVIEAKENVRPKGNYAFGRLVWSDGIHYVRSPLVVEVKNH